jgi:hypothetical protein
MPLTRVVNLVYIKNRSRNDDVEIDRYVADPSRL